jgi:hypothetical protein
VFALRAQLGGSSQRKGTKEKSPARSAGLFRFLTLYLVLHQDIEGVSETDEHSHFEEEKLNLFEPIQVGWNVHVENFLRVC